MAIAFDADGVPIAYGSRSDRSLAIDVPGVASFVLLNGGSGLAATPDAGCGRPALVDAYLGAALPFALQARGSYEALHASAVVTTTGAVAVFCGHSGSGKSTIAFGLRGRGYQQWADDVVCFRTLPDGGVIARALPFIPKLRAESAEHFSVSCPPAPDDPPSVETVEAPLAAVFIIDAVATGEVNYPRAERLPPGEALLTLLSNGFRFRPDSRQRRRRMLSRYLDLVGAIPVWHVRYPVGLDHLETLLGVIDGHVDG